MNLRDLQYLVTVAEQLHFGRAAELCHVSQPTLSMQLKKLEESLGVQLFERSNRQVLLTAVGQSVVARARRVLEEASQLRHIAQMHKDPLAGELRMGVFPTLAPYALPALVPELRKALPDLNLLLVEEKTPSLVQQLAEGKLDCALLAVPAEDDELDSALLFKEPFWLAVPVSHPLASRSSVTLEELKGQSPLLLDEGHCLREQALEVCHTIGIGESRHFRATSLETLRQMVAAGNAITLMPQLAIGQYNPAIRYIPFKPSAPARSIGLYWRKTSARTMLYKKIEEITRRMFGTVGKVALK